MEGVKSGAGAVSIQLPVDGSLDGVAGRNQSPDLPLQGRFIWSRWSGVSPTPYFSLTIPPPPSNTIQSQGSCLSQSFTLPSKSNLTEYWLRQPGAPAFLAWVGAPRGKSKARARRRGLECLHAMRTLAMVLLEDPDYPLDVWSSFYRAVNQGLAHCGCPGQFLVLPEQMRDERGAGVAGADDHRMATGNARCRPPVTPGG